MCLAGADDRRVRSAVTVPARHLFGQGGCRATIATTAVAATILHVMHMPPDTPTRRRVALLPVALLALGACGGVKPASTTAPTPTPVARDTTSAPAGPAPVAPAVFGEFATRGVMVFPLQRYAVGDSGWMSAATATGRPRAAQLDTALTMALRDKGLESKWSLPPNTSRVAQREVMNRTDPRSLATVGLTPSRRRNDVDLREPLGSQLRALIALVPETRYVLVPLEARVVSTATGMKQATLRIALLDARMSTVISFPDVLGPPAVDEVAALRGVALRFADLVVAP